MGQERPRASQANLYLLLLLLLLLLLRLQPLVQ